MPRARKRRIAAVMLAFGVATLAYPPGTMSVARWAADHDGVDVPYVRDCHGIFRHPQECGGHSVAAGRD